MFAKQLSVFLENKSGSLTEVTEILSKSDINLSSISVAGNSDFAILRCIVSDPDKACKVLKQIGYAVKITDVIGFICDNVPGSLSETLKYLAENKVFIEYLYSFNVGEKAVVVILPTDLDSCEALLKKKGVNLISAPEFNNL